MKKFLSPLFKFVSSPEHVSLFVVYLSDTIRNLYLLCTYLFGTFPPPLDEFAYFVATREVTRKSGKPWISHISFCVLPIVHFEFVILFNTGSKRAGPANFTPSRYSAITPATYCGACFNHFCWDFSHHPEIFLLLLLSSSHIVSQ